MILSTRLSVATAIPTCYCFVNQMTDSAENEDEANPTDFIN